MPLRRPGPIEVGRSFAAPIRGHPRHQDTVAAVAEEPAGLAGFVVVVAVEPALLRPWFTADVARFVRYAVDADGGVLVDVVGVVAERFCVLRYAGFGAGSLTDGAFAFGVFFPPSAPAQPGFTHARTLFLLLPTTRNTRV